jgi:hypothetical protein
MRAFNWPDEIQEEPLIAVPPKEEPEQKQGDDGLVAIYHDQHSQWITGYPIL